MDADAAGAADGSSWADAFPDLQQALAVAVAGDEVWVAEGTYRPTDGTDRHASFVLVSGVGLYGGFDGTETERDERDPEANVTVLSGDLGTSGEISDNAYHVVVASGVDSTTVLDGFTVTGGYGNGAHPRNRGAGIYGESSSLIVRDCRIVENRVVQTDGFGGGGGAFFGTSGTPRFERVAFEQNGLNGIGGGLWLFGEGGARSEAEVAQKFRAPMLHEEAISRSGPGGLSAMLREVTFTENTARFGGGAFLDEAALIAVESAFVRNVALAAAGGGLGGGNAITLVNTSFYGNVAKLGEIVSIGGGVAAVGGTVTFANVVFVGNVARVGAGLSAGSNGDYALTNATFAENEAPVEGGAIRVSSGSDLSLRNAVLWGNGDEINATSGYVNLSHTLIEGGCPPDASGEGTCESLLDADPLFARNPDPGPDGAWGTEDDDYGDLRLREGSPAVDFGLTAFLPPDTFDLDGDGDTEEPLPVDLTGEPRAQGEAVDLGAYERPGPVAAEPASPSSSGFRLDAYPNPARGPVTVGLDVGRAQRAEVTVYDLRGRRVTALYDGPLVAGSHALRLDTASLPSGVYVVRVRAGATSLTRRLVVLR